MASFSIRRDIGVGLIANLRGITLTATVCLVASCTSESTSSADGSGGTSSGGGGAEMGGHGGEGELGSCGDPKELTLVEVSSSGQGGAWMEPEFDLGEAPAGIVLCADGALLRQRPSTCDAMPLSRVELCDGFAPEFPPICSAEYFDESGNPTCAGEDCWAEGQCQADDECPAGYVCSCAAGLRSSRSSREQTGFTRCVPADCSTGRDCGDYDCAADLGACGVGVEGFHCHTEDDECHGHEECGESGRCTFSSDEKRWVCGQWALCE